MLLVFAAVGTLVQAIAGILALPLLPFVALGNVGSVWLGELEDILDGDE